MRLDLLIPNRTIREWTEALIFAVVVATFVRTYFFAPFQIPSGSMLPTIQIGDHIFASMYTYGSPIPFSDIKLFKKPVKRGDIVIFPYPQDPSIDYIKRAVGLLEKLWKFATTKYSLMAKSLKKHTHILNQMRENHAKP